MGLSAAIQTPTRYPVVGIATQVAACTLKEGVDVVSIAMLMGVYHEQNRIGACIRRHKQYVNQVFVTHDGPCEDLTLDIAERLGAVCQITPKREFYGDPSYEASRAWALSSGFEWGIVVAPDEWWNAPLLNRIRVFVDLANANEAVALQVLTRTSYVPKGVDGFSDREDRLVRIFKLDSAHYPCIIHYGVVVDGKCDILSDDYCIHHFPSVYGGVHGNADKKKRYIRVAQAQLEQYAGDPEVVEHLRTVIEMTQNAPDGTSLR